MTFFGHPRRSVWSVTGSASCARSRELPSRSPGWTSSQCQSSQWTSSGSNLPGYELNLMIDLQGAYAFWFFSRPYRCMLHISFFGLHFSTFGQLFFYQVDYGCDQISWKRGPFCELFRYYHQEWSLRHFAPRAYSFCEQFWKPICRVHPTATGCDENLQSTHWSSSSTCWHCLRRHSISPSSHFCPYSIFSSECSCLRVWVPSIQK